MDDRRVLGVYYGAIEMHIIVPHVFILLHFYTISYLLVSQGL